MARPMWSPPSGSTHLPGLKIYNSLTRSDVDFIPLQEGRISWYACGPTVYDDAHLGHARNYVTTDIIRRILRDYFNFNVRFVMNITDIDDKIILRARQVHFFEQYKKSHPYITPEVLADVRKAWVRHLEKNLPQINLQPPPEPREFDQSVAHAYGDVLKRSRPDGLTEEQIAKLKMHIKSAKSAAESLTADLKLIHPELFYNDIEDIMYPMLDDAGKATIKGDDYQVFTTLTQQYERRFFRDMRNLNVLDPDELVRVTEHGPQIAHFVKQIVENKFAYHTEDGSVYFDIQAFEAAGNSYAKLMPESKSNTELQAEGEGALGSKLGGKKSDADFALWKASKAGEPSWPSEWGPGRPGWHIECSAMASGKLGQQMDIHSGGIDLAFPHHDNELAQSEAYWKGHGQWVNYFIHMGHLSIKGAKMSKSLKNFTTIEDALKGGKAWTSRSLRIVFLLGQWRKGAEITDDVMAEAQSWEDRVDNFFLNADDGMSKAKNSSSDPSFMQKPLQDAQEKIRENLLNSFNTSQAMSAISDLITTYNAAAKETFTKGDHTAPAKYVTEMVNIFGLNGKATKEDAEESIGWAGLRLLPETEEYIRPLADARTQLRRAAIAGSLTKEGLAGIISTIPKHDFDRRRTDLNGARPLMTTVNAFGNEAQDLLAGQALTRTNEMREVTDLNKEVLELCDKFRDVNLWNLGVLLEDREDGPARLRPITSGHRAAREEREEKSKQKVEAKAKREKEEKEKLLKGKIPAADMYKPPYSNLYEAWDSEGVPTFMKGGEAKLSDSRRKKLKKDMAFQQKAHEKYLEAMGTGRFDPEDADGHTGLAS